jgi:general secretion pathway protein A
MYEAFFGLKEAPFSLTPDPYFLYLNGRSKEALNHILYGIERREGFALIVGDVGTGKTTLCWAILEKLEGKKNIRTALVQNPMLSETDILRSILQDLGARPDPGTAASTDDHKAPSTIFGADWMLGMSKKELLDRLNIFLAERAQEDVFTVLIIDESQNLSLELLEQLRLLSNLETSKKKLLQIIFAGQLELEQKLNMPAMRQLNQRISIRFTTQSLSREDTERYVRYRLVVAGNPQRLQWGRGTFRAIHAYSKGCPRLINLICDRTLLAAYSERSLLITPKMVRKAVRNLQGKEKLGTHWYAIWMKRILPAVAAVSLLLLLVASLAWKGTLAKMIRPLSQTSTTATEKPVDKKQPATENQTAPAPVQAIQNVPVSPARTSLTAQEGYALQVHSLRGQREAEQALSALKRKNWGGFVFYTPGAGELDWYAVYVGPFKDMNSAIQAAAALSSEEGLSPIIRHFQSENR